MEHKKFFIPCAGSCCCNLVVYLQLAIFLPHYLCLVFLLYHLQCYCLSRNEHKHNQNHSNCYPTAGSKTMYELQRTIKFYMQSFMFFSRTSSKSSQQSFFPSLCFHLHWKKFFCAKSNQKYLNILQYYSKGCSLAIRDTKDPIVMQIHLIAKEGSIRLLTVSHQRNPK